MRARRLKCIRPVVETLEGRQLLATAPIVPGHSVKAAAAAGILDGSFSGSKSVRGFSFDFDFGGRGSLSPPADSLFFHHGVSGLIFGHLRGSFGNGTQYPTGFFVITNEHGTRLAEFEVKALNRGYWAHYPAAGPYHYIFLEGPFRRQAGTVQISYPTLGTFQMHFAPRLTLHHA